MIPLVDLAATEAEVIDEALAAVAEVAREGCFVLGERVATFERWLAKACGTTHAVGVASGTDAIELALRALDVGAGDAVVTPAFSFVAAAEAIVAAGARPVFCDVDPRTMNASADTVREAIAAARAAGLRVRAVVPVHLFGRVAPVEELRRVAREEGLVVVEDAAQALGGRDGEGRAVGAGADAACFSFFPTKNLGAWGDAGAVVTSRDDVADRVGRLRAHGATSPYVHGMAGRNSRLDALQAAVLLAKAPRLARWLEARQRVAGRYLSELAGLPLELPHVPAAPARHAWHAFVVRTAGRDELALWLRERGVETRVYYPVPLHLQPCFAAFRGGGMAVAERSCREVLALPIYPALEGERQADVVAHVRAFFSRVRQPSTIRAE